MAMSNLDRDLAEMRRLGYGTNYGKYKLDHPNTGMIQPPPGTSAEKAPAMRSAQRVSAGM